MPANEYHFITHWRVEGTAEEVYSVLEDVASLARWWPAVYLEVAVIEPGGAGGVGKRVALHTKGWLPYTLRWQFRVTEARRPERLVLEAAGDFVGRGAWAFADTGSGRVGITYDWRIRADKPLLRALSFALKPVFAANHRWAMARGEESLRLELARRRARTPGAASRIPPPPGPTFRGGRRTA